MVQLMPQFHKEHKRKCIMVLHGLLQRALEKGKSRIRLGLYGAVAIILTIFACYLYSTERFEVNNISNPKTDSEWFRQHQAKVMTSIPFQELPSQTAYQQMQREQRLSPEGLPVIIDRHGTMFLDLNGITSKAWDELQAGLEKIMATEKRHSILPRPYAYNWKKIFKQAVPLESPPPLHLNWMIMNLNEVAPGAFAWPYLFDNTYNDATMKAPWSGAFGQARGIELCLAASWRSNDDKYLEIARKAAQILFIPLEHGGHLFANSGDYWFEEYPNSIDNPVHILNGHMRVLLALNELYKATNDVLYKEWFYKGLNTLERWLPLYDTGYALRYDLNPKKFEILFKFDDVNSNHREVSAFVDQIALYDPLAQDAVLIDLGQDKDMEGGIRLAGNNWTPPKQLGNVTTRGILPAATYPDSGAYFYLVLPSEWNDNLRTAPYELYIKYFDNKPGKITLQQRAMAPGPEYVPVKDGEIELIGDNKWHIKKVFLRPNDLGFWVGLDYAKMHYIYLQELADFSPIIAKWAETAKAYCYKAEGIQDMALNAQIVSGDLSNDFVAGTDEDAPRGIIIDLGRKSIIRDIKIEFDDINEDGFDFSLDSVAYSPVPATARVFRNLVTVTSHKTKIWEHNFSLPHSASYLRLMFTKTPPISQFSLDKINIMVEPPTELQSFLLAPGAEEDFLSADDFTNPLYIFNFSIPKGVVELSNHLTTPAMSEHQKIITFMELFHSHPAGLPETGAPLSVLLKEIGACGDWSGALLALARAQGMEGRYVNFHNYPPNRGHTVVEIKVNGKWQLYDPTYGLYYTTEPDNHSNPHVLGFTELREGGAEMPDVSRVVMNQARLAAGGAFADPNIYTQSRPAGPIGPGFPMQFPLSLQAGGKTLKSEFGLVRQGADFLGTAYYNANQEWSLENLTPGQEYAFVLTPSGLHDEESLADNVAASFALDIHIEGTANDRRFTHTFDRGSTDTEIPRELAIRFTALRPQAKITFSHPYRGPKNHYLSIEQYALMHVQ